jgi:hypothetical protein
MFNILFLSTDVVEISSAESDYETEETTQLNKTVADEDVNFTDSHNCPDKQGRVLINVGHPADENDIYLNPRLAASVKRHQVSSSILLVVLHGSHQLSIELGGSAFACSN